MNECFNFKPSHTDLTSSITVLFVILLVTIVILVIISLNINSKSGSIPKYDKLFNMLKERYAKGDITADDYRERSMILEDEYYQDDYWLYAENAEMIHFKEKYVKGEIDSREYIEQRTTIKKLHNTSPLTILKERLENGEISEAEYKKIRNEIR